MKITIQFKNDNSLEFNKDVDIEIPDIIMDQFKEAAKKYNCSVEEIIQIYLKLVAEQIETEDNYNFQEGINPEQDF